MRTRPRVVWRCLQVENYSFLHFHSNIIPCDNEILFCTDCTVRRWQLGPSMTVAVVWRLQQDTSQVSKVTITFTSLLLTATYVPTVTLYYYMSGCLHPRAPATCPDRLRRRIWNMKGKTVFINHKSQVHKTEKYSDFRLLSSASPSSWGKSTSWSCLAAPAPLHRQSGRQELNFSPHHLPDNWPRGKRSLWCWCWITFCLYSK